MVGTWECTSVFQQLSSTLLHRSIADGLADYIQRRTDAGLAAPHSAPCSGLDESTAWARPSRIHGKLQNGGATALMSSRATTAGGRKYSTLAEAREIFCGPRASECHRHPAPLPPHEGCRYAAAGR